MKGNPLKTARPITFLSLKTKNPPYRYLVGMNALLLTYFFGFVLAVVLLSIYCKRRYRIPYDSRTLISTALAAVVLIVSTFIFQVNYAELLDLKVTKKILGAVSLFLILNAVIQFILWIIYSLTSRGGWLRLPRFVFNLFSYLLLVGVGLYILKYVFNQPLTGLLVTSTVVSAVIGLSLQETLANLVSGISLQVESPFVMDEWVNLGGYEGKVVSQNWRTVTLLTRENHRVSLTNRFVAEDKIVNYSRPTRRQIHNFYIELDYAHPPYAVKKSLDDLLEDIEEVEIGPGLGTFVDDYMASGIKYCLKYSLADYADIVRIQDLVLSRLWYALRRNDLKIPYPTSEIQMQVVSPEAISAISSPAEIPQRLARIDWLRTMDAANVEKLAASCHTALYATGDTLVRQGDVGDSMYIILGGQVRVAVATDKLAPIEVAQKCACDFFGEMSLLTGEPRSASVIAMEDTEVLIIDKSVFTEVISKDKEVLAQLVDALADCQSGLAAAIEAQRKNSNTTKAGAHQLMIRKIRRYLMLDG